MVRSLLFCVLGALCLTTIGAEAAPAGPPAALPPTDNPAAWCDLPWTAAFPWTIVVTITGFRGADWDARFEAAQAALGPQGGVVYFPAGTYQFHDTLKLRDRVIIRGATPLGPRDGRYLNYAPPTKFVFPAYVFSAEGAGTPKDTAFKGIELAQPHTTTHCGVVNVDINHGHIKFGADVYDQKPFQEGFANYGRNHIIYGCVLRNAAVADPNVPQPWQQPWQRWTHRHNAAIDIRANSNVLVANCQVPESGDNDFAMKGYVLHKGDTQQVGTRDDVVFHYDNRPGMYVNYGTTQGTPETHPWCFAKGIVIRNNYVYCYGCLAIGFSGDGTYCGFNMVRYPPNAYLPIYTGVNESHHVNNCRAVEMRGWRWTVEGNDYEVYSNVFDEQGNRYNDGEGLMHEGFGNVGIVDSRLINNTGNRYLCLWRAPVDGLLIQGNHVWTDGGQPAICVLGTGKGTTADAGFAVRNVRILDNITEGTGIFIVGKECENNLIQGNRHVGPGGVVDNKGKATVEQNEGYVAK